MHVCTCNTTHFLITGTKFAKDPGVCSPTSISAARSLADCINICATETSCTHAAFSGDQCHMTTQSQASLNMDIQDVCWSKNFYWQKPERLNFNLLELMVVHFDFNQIIWFEEAIMFLHLNGHNPYELLSFWPNLCCWEEKITLICFVSTSADFIIFKSKKLRITIDIKCSMIFTLSFYDNRNSSHWYYWLFKA